MVVPVQEPVVAEGGVAPLDVEQSVGGVAGVADDHDAGWRVQSVEFGPDLCGHLVVAVGVQLEQGQVRLPPSRFRAEPAEQVDGQSGDPPYCPGVVDGAPVIGVVPGQQ